MGKLGPVGSEMLPRPSSKPVPVCVAPYMFSPPDHLWQLVVACVKSRNYARHWWRWVRYGPDEKKDAIRFRIQWEMASVDGGTEAVTNQYLDQREQRRESARHLKSDFGIFMTVVGVVMSILLGMLAYVSLAGIHRLLHSPHNRLALLTVLMLLWMAAMRSYTAGALYAWWTHYEGAAQRNDKVIGNFSYTDSVRREVNRLSRVIQRGRRLFGLARMLASFLVLVLAVSMFLRAH